MDMIINVFNRTMTCLEGICDDVECNIDSGCCHTRKKMHDKENKSVWLAGNHQVEEIINKFNQTFYKISNFNKLLSRHEILKVS